MKKITLLTFLFLFVLSTNIFANTTPLKKDFKMGNPEIGSINALTFGPEGILFIGDSKSAQIMAVDLSAHPTANNEKISIKKLDVKLAEMLGASVDEVQITDMVVNPANQNIYLSVSHSSGKSMLFMVKENKLEQVPLTNVSFSKTNISDVVAADAEDKRGRSLRKWAVSDIHYADGKVMLSGLSNQEFASTFRAIDFPFNEKQMHSSLEIYHAAHGKYETHAPIKTFTTAQINGKPSLIASYTCTPLVVFPMSTLENGKHTKGKTVAELGNWNTPLDIIEMEKGGNRYILMANSSRAVMKIKISDIETFGDSLDSRVEERSGTSGVDFINLPFVNVLQLDKLNDQQFLMIQREANGDLVMKTGGNRWL